MIPAISLESIYDPQNRNFAPSPSLSSLGLPSFPATPQLPSPTPSPSPSTPFPHSPLVTKSTLNPNAAPFVPLSAKTKHSVTTRLDEACRALADADRSVFTANEHSRKSLSQLRSDLRRLRAELDAHDLLDAQNLLWDKAENRLASPTARVYDEPVLLSSHDLEILFPKSDDLTDIGGRVRADLLRAVREHINEAYQGEHPRSPTISERSAARRRFTDLMDVVKNQPSTPSPTPKPETKSVATQTTVEDRRQVSWANEKACTQVTKSLRDIIRQSKC